MATNLGTFEERQITKTTIAIRNAGDGLSQAMAIDPKLLHQGDTVFVVMECKVGPVSFDPIKDSETECVRKHVLRAGAATIVDAALVEKAVTEQTARILEAREKEAGIQQLPTPEKLTKDHDKGKHDESPYIGCPVCDPPPVKKSKGATVNAAGEVVNLDAPKVPAKKPAGATTGATKPTKASGAAPKKAAAAKKAPAKKA